MRLCNLLSLPAEVEHMSLALSVRTGERLVRARRDGARQTPRYSYYPGRGSERCNLLVIAQKSCENFGFVHNSVAARSFRRS